MVHCESLYFTDVNTICHALMPLCFGEPILPRASFPLFEKADVLHKQVLKLKQLFAGMPSNSNPFWITFMLQSRAETASEQARQKRLRSKSYKQPCLNI